jgi:hypothetical protein
MVKSDGEPVTGATLRTLTDDDDHHHNYGGVENTNITICYPIKCYITIKLKIYLITVVI